MSIYGNGSITTQQIGNYNPNGPTGFFQINGGYDLYTTNYLPYATQMQNWTASGGVVSAPTVTGNSLDYPDPRGNHTATKVAFPAVTGAGAYSLISTTTTAFPAGSKLMFSVYTYSSSGSPNLYLITQDSAGTYQSYPISFQSPWVRYSFALQVPVGVTLTNFSIGCDLRDGSQTSSLSGTVYLWGAQVEQMPFLGLGIPTVQIPNVGAGSATRSFTANTITSAFDRTSFEPTAKIASFANLDAEVAFVSAIGNISSSNSGIGGATTIGRDASSGYPGLWMGIAPGSEAVSNYTLLTTDATNLLINSPGAIPAFIDFRSANTPMFKMYFDGAGGNTVLAAEYTNSFRMLSNVTDGASAVAYKLDTNNTLANASALLFQTYNNGLPEFYIDLNGNVGIGLQYTYPLYLSGSNSMKCPTVLSGSGSALALLGNQADGASAIGVEIGTNQTFSTPGSKLVSVTNNTVELFYIDYAGNVVASGTISGGGSPPLTGFTTFGSTPNADGGSTSSTSIILQPADGSHPGGISLSAQTMGSGVKTFSSNPAFSAMTVAGIVHNSVTTGALTSSLIVDADVDAAAAIAVSKLAAGTNTYVLTTTGGVPVWAPSASGYITSLAAVGSSPNADAASVIGGALTLQPADGSNPGLILGTSAAQTLAPTFTFSAYGTGLLHSGSGGAITSSLVVTADITAANVTYAKIQNVAATSILGNNTGSPASAIELTYAQVNTALGTTGAATSISAPAAATDSNGITLSSHALSLEYADGTHPGIIQGTSAAQTLVPTFTFSNVATFTLGATMSSTLAMGTNTISGNFTATGSLTLGSGAAASLALGNTTGNSTFTGSVQYTTRTLSAATLTVDTTTTDYEILCTRTATGTCTITLPAPTNGRYLTIKDAGFNAGTNNITVARHASEKIEGVASNYTINSNGVGIILTSDGTDWFLVSYQAAGGSGITQLTSDVAAGPGSGSQAATIQPGVVTLAKMANLAADTIIGNNTGSPATPLALTVSQVNTLLGTTGAATSVTTPAAATDSNGITLTSQVLSLEYADATHPGIIAGTSVAQTLVPTFTFSNAATFSSGATMSSTLAMGTNTISGNFTASGALTFSNYTTAGVLHNAVTTGAITSSLIVTADITAANVTYAKIQNVAANSIVGNNTGSPASATDLSTAQMKTLLGYYTSGDSPSFAAVTITGAGALTVNSGTAASAFGGSIAYTNRTLSAATLTVDTTTTDYAILVTRTATGVCTITLPAPTSGRRLYIKDAGFNAATNNITIAQHASEKIENVAGSYTINWNGGAIELESDGTDWFLSTTFAPVSGYITSLAAVGSSPNADAASVVTGALTLQPADATHPGVVLGTSAAQTLAPTFTFSNAATFSSGATMSSTLAMGTNTISGNFTASGTLTFSGYGTGLLHSGSGGAITSSLVVTADITAANVTYAKIQNVAATSILGNNTGSPASIIELTYAQVNTALGTTGAATSVTTPAAATDSNGLTLTSQVLSLEYADATHPGIIKGTSATQTLVPTFTFSNAATFSTGATMNGTLAMGTNTISGAFTASGALTFSNYTTAGVLHNAVTTGAITSSLIVTADITAANVTYAKIQNVAANSILGNNTGSPASAIELTAAQVNTFLSTTGAATSVGAPAAATDSNGLTLTSHVLNLEYADGTHPGIIQGTSAAQTLVPTFTFSNVATFTLGATMSSTLAMGSNSITGNWTAGGSITLGSTAASTLAFGNTTGNTSFIGSAQYTTRTLNAATLTVDTTTTDYEILVTRTSTGTCTITLPAPTNGRQLYIKDTGFNAGTNNITIARHASEKIENVAGNYTMSTNGQSIELTSDGTDWFIMAANGTGGGSGVTTVGAFSASSQANGASISGTTITFGPADNTNPGLVRTVADTWYGVKTFNSVPVASGLTTPAATGMTLTASVANSGSNVALILNNTTSLSGSTKLLSLQNNTTEKFAVLNDGTITTSNATASINNLLPSQTGVTSGWILQTNGTNVSWAAPGAGSSPTYGTATINFGSTPGTNYVTVTVTGQTGIGASPTVWCFMMGDTTASHNAIEHIMAPIKLVASDVIAGTGFTINAVTTERLDGTFTVHWAWQ